MSGSKRERPRSGRSAKPASKGKPAIVPMYARLPKGPHGLGPTGVARNQRLRMHGGMIEAIATHGYRRTSVRHVIGLAGVSRRAFYEQFSGKEDCFLATFDLIVKRMIQQLTQACRTTEGGPDTRLRLAFAALGEELAHNPKALHLALVEAQVAGPKGLERLHRMTALCESRMADVLGSGQPPARDDDRERPAALVEARPQELPRPVVRGIVGGMRRVVHTHLHGGPAKLATRELASMLEAAVQWSLLFSPPTTAHLRPRAHAAPPLPAGPARLEPEACGGQSARARLLRSAAELRAREDKPEELSSLGIAEGARLPIETFMELFSSPEECYLEALDVLGDELLQVVADPGLVSAQWAAAVCRAVARLLAHLASSPVRLSTLAVRALEAGPPAIAHVEDLFYDVATLLTEGAPNPGRTPIAVEAIAGALWRILNCEALAGRGPRLPVLCEHVSYVVLVPFLGPEDAVAAIAQSRETPAALPAVNGTGAGSEVAPPRNGAAVGRNGSGSAHEDYRRLAERRSAKCVNTTPTSTESTITTIRGA